MPTRRYLDTLAKKKRESTPQLLFRCSRLLNECAMARVRARGGATNLRTAHTALLPHLDFEGVRLTTLAERAGVTKQAVGQLLDDMEAEGVVERLPDPTDGRAKLVRFSKKGQRGLLDGLAVLSDLEKELAERVGRAHMNALHESLTRLLPVLEAEAAGRRDAGKP